MGKKKQKKGARKVKWETKKSEGARKSIPEKREMEGPGTIQQGRRITKGGAEEVKPGRKREKANNGAICRVFG